MKVISPLIQKRRSLKGQKTTHTTVILPTQLSVALRQLSRDQNRSLSDMFTEIVNYYLDVNYPGWEVAMSEQEGRS